MDAAARVDAAGRWPVYRFFAHLLIRLLILMPMPADAQARAAFFPLSLVWSLSPPAPAPSDNARQESGNGILFSREGSPLSESLGGGSSGGGNRTRQQRITGVGGRLALSEAGILFSTERSVFGGTDVPLGGVRTAALGKLGFITKVIPDPILVDQEGIFLDRPSLEYRSLPPLTTNNATIDIDKNQTEFRQLLASLTAGKGASDWFEDRPLDPKATYTATPDFRDEDNTPLPAVTKRLGVTRLPLTAETRDRQLEVRFAVPASSTKSYALRIYLAAGTSPLPTTPTLSLPWTAIQSAYDSDEDVFEDFSSVSPKSGQPYVIRKIQRVTIPGRPLLKEQRAFVLDAVFGGYHRYRVSLVEEGQNPRECARVEGQAVYDSQWADVLDGLAAGAAASAGMYQPSDRVRLASRMPLFAMQIPPDQALDWMLYSSGISRVTLPIKKAVGFAKDAWGNVIQPSFPVQYVIGLYSGFLDGVVGDWQAIRHPLDTLRAIGEAVSTFVKLVKSTFEADGWLVGGWRSVRRAAGQLDSYTPLQFLDVQNRFAGKVGYVWGYLAGMFLWQVVTFIGLAALTEGVGAVVEKAIVLAKAAATAINLSEKVARMLAVLGRVADFVAEHARLGEAVESMSRLWKVTKDLAEGPLTTVALKYRNFTKTLEPALARMAVAADHGKRIVEVFSRVASMPDEVALRLLEYMAQGEGKTAKVASWLTKHTARNVTEAGVASNRAVKEAAEAAGQALKDMPDEAVEILVLAADAINVGDGLGARNLVKTFADKYRGLPQGQGLLDILKLLRTGADDTRYSDAVLARVVRVQARVQAPFSPQAVEGSARLLRDGGSPLDEIEDLSRALMDGSPENADTLLRTLTAADDARPVEGFAEAMHGIPCVLQ